MGRRVEELPGVVADFQNLYGSADLDELYTNGRLRVQSPSNATAIPQPTRPGKVQIDTEESTSLHVWQIPDYTE